VAESKSISLDQVKESAQRFLYLKDDNMIDVAMAVYVANKLSSDPLWMFFTGPPSSAKTEILRAMDGHDSVELISSLTPSTLISGRTIKGKGNMSLLPKLTGKMLIIKDFGTILTLYREARGEIFAQLREVYDGQFSKSFGTGETISWNGKIGVLAGVTPAIDKYMSVNAMLGERFLHYRMGDDSGFSVGSCAFDNVLAEDENRQNFQANVNQFMAQFDGNLTFNLKEVSDIRERIVTLAMFCAHARSAVYRHRYDQTLEAMPQPEGPARLTKQLKLLAMGLAVVRGQSALDEAIYEIVKKTARDTLPRLRLEVLRTLWDMHLEKPHSWHTTKQVAMAADIPTTTAKLKLENMNLLRLVSRDREGDADNAPYIWQPTELMERLVDVSKVFPY